MNTKNLHLLYGLALIIIVPFAAWLFLSNRNLAGENKAQTERLEFIESKVSKLEKLEEITRSISTQKQSESTSAAEVVEETAEDTQDNTVTDKKQYSIQVLNARGVQGVAGSVQETLEAGGFYVTDIDNARWQLESTISVKKGLESFAEEVKKELKDEYTFVSVDELEADSDYDLVIYIGSK